MTLRTLIIVLITLTLAACATATREAEPLEIRELIPEKATPSPLVIQRTTLTKVLSRGPGRFFERMPVTPYKAAGRFVGFQIVAVYGQVAPHPNGIHVGDVVTAVNGKPVRTPGQFMAVWNGMKKAGVLQVDLVRGQQLLRIDYKIVE
jgi:type II secretory pathway component PulC